MSIADKLTTIAENVPKVYDAGKKVQNGYFWDAYLQKGARTDYAAAFANDYFSEQSFKPTYDIKPTTCQGMFRQTYLKDIKSLFREAGVTLDTSNCTYFLQSFQSNKITHLPTIDISKATNTSYALSGGALVSIDELIVSETTVFNNTFTYNYMLENMPVEGIIAKTGFNTSWSKKLNKESLRSIVVALSDTTSGLTVTLSKTSVNKAFETTEGLGDGETSSEWTTLVASKSNWTITLIDS